LNDVFFKVLNLEIQFFNIKYILMKGRSIISSFTGRLLKLWQKSKIVGLPPDQSRLNNSFDGHRRKIIKRLTMLPFIGPAVLSWYHPGNYHSFEEKHLKIRQVGIHEKSPENKVDPMNKIPQAQLGKETISRMILGGNLIGGWAHARDLLYVSELVTTYFTDEKIFETFALAEKSGINAFLTNPVLIRVINEYWKRDLGKIKFISDCGGQSLQEGIQVSIDNGASVCYVHGGIADNLVESGKVDEIARGLELIRKNGLPAGIGGHKLETVKACVDYGLEPDFWMKTIHPVDYWSAIPETEHDNIWCTNPDETKAYMQNIKQPWIGYKTLAAGAIEPEMGFRYAFESGADFLCVGMFDFQINNDVAAFLNVLNSKLNRERPWRA
jgi:hypothetical protein